jgi:hypothetical protein
MNKFLLKASISVIVFLGIGFFLPVFALAENNITITPDPIFKAENIFPGYTENRTINIKNNTENDYNVINLSGQRVGELQDLDLAEMIDLEIKKGDDLIFVNLAQFLSGDVLTLPQSGINKNGEKDFIFTIKLRKGTGNEYQGKFVFFNFIFTFTGEKTDEIIVPAARGRAFLLEDTTLKIFGEEERMVTQEGATITWETNIPATSKVIYGKTSGQFDYNAGPPAYGYEFYKDGDDSGEEKVISHRVTLTDLLSGTTYYYRVVSSASPPSISRQYSFTTAGIAGEYDERPDYDFESDISLEPEPETSEGFLEEDVLGEEITEETEDKDKESLSPWLAALTTISEEVPLYYLILFFAIILFILWLFKKKKKKKE